MAISDAKVEITYGELQGLQDKVRDLEKENSKLKLETSEAKLGPDGNLARQYREAFAEAMTIVRFAVSNMHPLTVRGWPYKSLEHVCKANGSLPGIDQDSAETANDMKIFARECREWEISRDNGTEQEKLRSGGGGFTPEDIQAAKTAKAAEGTASDPS